MFLAAIWGGMLAGALLLQPQEASAQPTKKELQQDVNDLTSIDPEIEKYLPRWKILEADLKIKLAQLFKSEGYPVSEADSMVVTATFPREGQPQELLKIRVGNDPNAQINGSRTIRARIGDGLYDRILGRDYAHNFIEPATPITNQSKERIPNVLQPVNAKQFIAVSAFRQTVQIGTSSARIEHSLGSDEVGYPFWSGGQGKVGLYYPIIKLDDAEKRANGVPDILTVMLGGGYRLKFGGPNDDFLSGVISPRLLNGALGAKALAKIEYRLPQVNDFGFSMYAEVPFNKLRDEAFVPDGSVVWNAEPVIKKGSIIPDTAKAAYFLRNVAQGGIFYETWLNDYEHFFRISLGASYQEVARGFLGLQDENGRFVRQKYSDDSFAPNAVSFEGGGLWHPTEMQDWLFAKVEYLNQSGFPFGMSAQLSNSNLLISGFIPLIPNWLFIEAKYSTPILRDNPQPWENPTFFMLSPILRFKIDQSGS
jgi:hypothetical protein